MRNPKALKRLWRHCSLSGAPGKRRLPARARLEAALGSERAAMLLKALAGDHGFVRRTRRLRVKSSP